MGGNTEAVAIGPVQPRLTLAEADADVSRMIQIAFRSFPLSPAVSLKLIESMRLGPNLRPLKEEVVGDIAQVLWVLMGGISLILMIASANVANLMLVRIEGRRQELALRAALGGSRGRIATALFSESLILAVLGAFCGLGIAYGALRVLVAVAPTDLPRLNEIGIDGRVLLFILVVSVAVSVMISSVAIFKYSGSKLGTPARRYRSLHFRKPRKAPVAELAGDRPNSAGAGTSR